MERSEPIGAEQVEVIVVFLIDFDIMDLKQILIFFQRKFLGRCFCCFAGANSSVPIKVFFNKKRATGTEPWTGAAYSNFGEENRASKVKLDSYSIFNLFLAQCCTKLKRRMLG